QIKTVEECNRIGYRKFYYDPYIIPYTQFYDNDFYSFLYIGSPKIYLFRYAHTLLTYAEAAARSGQLDEKAYECVNRIRRRARNVDIYSPSDYDLQPGLSPEVFADSVVWERAWELAGEPEGRWFDLVRLEMVEDLPALRHPAEGGPPEVFDKTVYFFPVPEGDIRLNPNLDIE
ncbi:MAG: RagB/SusD family nutrient uptake outer membrane protein, partial [Bacteroidales bacterium]